MLIELFNKVKFNIQNLEYQILTLVNQNKRKMRNLRFHWRLIEIGLFL